MEESIENSDAREVKVLLRAGYMRAEEVSPKGRYWLEQACVFGAKDDTNIVDILIEQGASPLHRNGTPLRYCLSSPAKFEHLAAAANREAIGKGITRDEWLTPDFVTGLFNTNFDQQRGPSKTREEFDADIKLKVELLVEAGINPIFFTFKGDSWTNARQPAPIISLIEAARVVGLPQTAAYMQSVVDKGPCKREYKAGLRVEENGHINPSGYWAQICGDKFCPDKAIYEIARVGVTSPFSDGRPDGLVMFSYANSFRTVVSKGTYTGHDTYSLRTDGYPNQRNRRLVHDPVISEDGCKLTWYEGIVYGR